MEDTELSAIMEFEEFMTKVLNIAPSKGNNRAEVEVEQQMKMGVTGVRPCKSPF